MKRKHYTQFSKVFLLLIILFPVLVNAQAIKDSIRKNYTIQDYENFLLKEMRGEIPSGKGIVGSSRSADALVNNNTGTNGTSSFTQSETSILAFGTHVLVGFNDAGSFTGGANKFTGYSYSSDGGVTFTDGGTLPTNAGGDAGDPVLARNESTGRIYFSTLGFSVGTIQVFHSDDNGVSWSAPVNGTPGGSSEDKQWIAVDNFAGSGNGNVYLISRSFGAPNGIYMYRSTDNGATFGPTGGVQIVAGKQGAFVVVGPDHAVYAFWYDGVAIKMRKSTDQGLTFAAAVTVVSGLTGGVNGDLALTGLRQGTATFAGFRSNEFPHAAVNLVSGDLYVTFDDNPAGTDKGDIYMVTSTDGGTTWSARTQINDDGTTTDNWMPTIAVTSNGNNIGIFYYSREDDAVNNNLFTYNGRLGVISGSTITFTPSFVISDVQSLPEFGRDGVVNSTYMGDYNSASATATDFHIVWSDNRDDLAGGAPRKDPNVYYKSISAGLLAGANISVLPSSIDFGNVEVNQTGGPVQVTITNIGDADLTVSTISSPNPDFMLSNIPALPATLSSLGTLTVDVSFTPLSEGIQNASFDISSDALNTPVVTVNLTGSGLTAPANDLCDDAIAIECGSSTDGYTILATADNVGTCGGVTNTSPGVWYSIVGNGYPLTLATCTAADFDTKISVFSGTCAALICEGGNDNSCGVQSRLTFNTTDGTTYYILVHGAGSTTGTFSLTALCSPEIEVAPVPLTFTVPLNGTASDLLTISNPAGSSDLSWTIINSEEALSPFVNASSATSELGEEKFYMYKVTNGTIFTLQTQNLPVDVLHNLDKLRILAPCDKETFLNKVSEAIGDENTTAYYENILESSGRTETESILLADGEYWKGKSGITLKKDVITDSEIYGAGGPDGGNYFWIDSDEPGGPVFNWTDISSTGTAVTLGDDAAVLITLPFSFTFYGNSKPDVYIGSNGFLTFSASGNTTFTNSGIPNANAPSDLISPFWDDLNPALGGTIHYLSTATQLIVQYTNIKPFSGSGTYTFQVILNDDGSIVYQYLSMTGVVTSSTVGIENATGTTGLQLAFNSAYIHDNLAVKIALPDACPFITSVSPTTGTISGGGTQQVTVNVDATGLALGTYECHLTVFSNAANTNKLDVPVILNVIDPGYTLPFVEDWESNNGTAIGNSNIYDGAGFGWSFETNLQDKGRARWGTDAYLAHNGAGALTLDKLAPSTSYSINASILTIDLSSYTSSADLYLNFWWTDHGDEEHPNDKVWIRGSNSDAWVMAYDINPATKSNNRYNFSGNIDIDQILSNAVPPQAVGNTFQVKFGQEDNCPTSTDGISFDDIMIYEVSYAAATLPFFEGLETNNGVITNTDYMFIEPDHGWYFDTDLPNKGRARWGTNSHQKRTGTGALTLDKLSPSTTYSVNSSTLIVNLENYVSSTDLELTFWWADHGDEEHPNDKVWIRGSKDDVWQVALDLNPTTKPNNQYQFSGIIDIDQILANASPAQTVSKSFQVRFGQEDNGSTPNDGISFDDITIQETAAPPLQPLGIGDAINLSDNSFEVTNYPNPFSGTTTIEFKVGNMNDTRLIVFNSLGKEVSVLYDEVAVANLVYKVEFNGNFLAPGIYYYRLISGDKINAVKKMILTK